MAAVPEVFNQPGAAFVLLRPGEKFPPIEKEWQKHPHSYDEALRHNGNVGLMAGNGYIGLDQDDPTAFEGLTLPATTKWQTRPGRYGLWFKADDVAEVLAAAKKKPDFAQFKLFKDGLPCGELKLHNTYQIIPPSHKHVDPATGVTLDPKVARPEFRVDYMLLDGRPPATISLVWLVGILKAAGISFSSKLDQNAAKLEALGKEQQQKRVAAAVAEQKEGPGQLPAIEPATCHPARREQAYAEAALQDELATLKNAKEGVRNAHLNASAFSLGQFVGAGLLQESEVVGALREVAIQIGLPEEEAMRTIQSGIDAGMEDPRDIPPAGPTVIDAIRALDSVCDGAISKDGAGFNKFDREENSDLIDKAINEGTLTPKEEKRAYKLLKKYSKQLKPLGIKYEDIGHIAREGGDAQSHEIEQEKFTDDIKTKALEVLQTGDPVQVVVDSCGRMVLGAERAFKKLICCVSVQNIRQSSGLHPKLSGNSGGGKTWTVYAFAHHLPKEAVVKGSMSAKAGFYHFDGDRVFRILDDYQAGNEDLDTVIKQTTSEFHEPFIHRTVIKQQPVSLEIGSEQTWAITSIENDQDIQVLNRSIPINVDDSEDLTRCVNNHTIERYGRGESSKLLDDTVLICRAMFQILRDEGYIDVRVPFYDRIEWIDTSNRRNPSIFMDLVIAHTAMFRYQRERDAEGFYLATEEDFEAARELFTDNDGEELVKRFTAKEREALEFMASRPDGVTADDIAERLGVSRTRSIQILTGKDGRGGLSDKVTLLKTNTTEMMDINADERRSVHKTYFRIANYDRFSGFDAVVRLKPKTATGEGVTPVTDGVTYGVTPQTNNRKDGVTIVIDNRYKREEKGTSSFCGKKVELSHVSSKIDENGYTAAADAESEGYTEGYTKVTGVTPSQPVPVYGVTPSPAADAPTADQQDVARVEHFEKKAKEVSAKSPNEIPRPYCYLAKVRGAAIIEYGYNGWVDPAKIAKATGILECQACRALCHLGYVQIERQGGGIGFRQKTAADAAVVA